MGDDVGNREVKYQGPGSHGNEIIVEDIRGEDGATYRQLVFSSNLHIVQSQAKLVTGKVTLMKIIFMKKSNPAKRSNYIGSLLLKLHYTVHSPKNDTQGKFCFNLVVPFKVSLFPFFRFTFQKYMYYIHVNSVL